MDIIHGHDTRVVPAGQFKQTCLALLDTVAETGLEIVVTKRGRPVAKVVPVDDLVPPLPGSVRVIAENDEDLYSTGEGWELEPEK